MLDRPCLSFFLSMALCLWLATQLGVYLRKRRPLRDNEREDFGVIQAATLNFAGSHYRFQFLHGHQPL